MTLTYAPEHLPTSGSLKPEDATNFLKKLRNRIYPEKIRYLLVGEYGDQTMRPHYHASIFGLGMEHHQAITSSWAFGHARVDDFNWKTAQYVAGYILKKTLKKDLPSSLHPEFTRMSRRPGIGATAIPVIAETIFKNGSKTFDSYGDVPTTVRINGKLCPLGRYLTDQLRACLGMPTQPSSPLRRRPEYYQKILDQKSFDRSLKMLAVHVTQEGITFADSIKKENAGRAASLAAREKIHRSTRSL